jgi:hypothetical protein
VSRISSNLRYSLTAKVGFLLQLLIVIAFLLAEVLLSLDTLSMPYAFLLARLLPEIYSPEALSKGGERPCLHPAFASGLLTVSIATLVLFFASGLYTEKVAYANRYVFCSWTYLDSLLLLLSFPVNPYPAVHTQSHPTRPQLWGLDANVPADTCRTRINPSVP